MSAQRGHFERLCLCGKPESDSVHHRPQVSEEEHSYEPGPTQADFCAKGDGPREMPAVRPRKPRWLYQGVRPRWVRLRSWERIFEDGYRAALEDAARAAHEDQQA